MIRFSRREDYSVIFIYSLVNAYQKRLVPLSEIARNYQISVLFLRNLASQLKKAQLVGAVEGKNGGYFLMRDPQEITVGDVLSVFSQKSLVECCSLSKEHKGLCPKASYCDPGFVWRTLNDEIVRKIYSMNFIEFVKKREALS